MGLRGYGKVWEVDRLLIGFLTIMYPVIKVEPSFHL